MVDPIKHLSPEALTQIFSYLSTAALTRCSSTSKAWRREILVDSILHRNLDLTSLEGKVTELELIQIIHDVSSRSQLTYRECHLDLTCFWNELSKAYRVDRFVLPLTFGKAMEATSYRYSSLITTIYLATKGQLEKLFFTTSQESIPISDIQFPFSQVIIQGGIQLSQMMPNSLKELHFTLPFPFSMSLGSQDQGSRKFTIIEDNYFEGPVGDALLCIDFLQKAKDFTGKSLTMFKVKSDNFVDPHEDWTAAVQEQARQFKRFLKEVRRSSTYLKELHLEIDEDRVPDVALSLVVKSPLLSSLTLKLTSSTSLNRQVKQIEFPTTESSSHLKFLKMELDHVNFDWESRSFMTWIGSSLQVLSLGRTWLWGQGKIEIPLISLFSILNNNPALEDLTLGKVTVIKHSYSLPSSTLSLPNLQTFDLDSPFLARGVFNNLSADRLQVLKVKLSTTEDEKEKELSRKEGNKSSSDVLFENLVHLLTASQCSIKTLSIQETSNTAIVGEKNIRNLCFPNLKLIKIPQSSARLDELMSAFHFPKIQRFQNESDYSKCSSISSVALLLASSSSSLEQLVVGSKRVHFRPFAPDPRGFTKDLEKSRKPIFSKLRSLTFHEGALVFLDFFCEAEFGGLFEKVAIRLEYEDEKSKASHLQSLISFLRINATSLTDVEVSRSFFGDAGLETSRFIKSENDLELAAELQREPIDFSSLKSLSIVGSFPLLEMFQICKTPKLIDFYFDEFSIPRIRKTAEEFRSYDQENEFRKERMGRERAKVEARESEENAGWNSEEEEREREAEERFEERRVNWI